MISAVEKTKRWACWKYLIITSSSASLWSSQINFSLFKEVKGNWFFSVFYLMGNWKPKNDWNTATNNAWVPLIRWCPFDSTESTKNRAMVIKNPSFKVLAKNMQPKLNPNLIYVMDLIFRMSIRFQEGSQIIIDWMLLWFQLDFWSESKCCVIDYFIAVIFFEMKML